MFRHYYISKEWMVSGRAHRIYRLSATLSLTFMIFLMAIKPVREIPESLFPAVKLLLFLGVAGSAITLVAMQYFLFGFDNSSPLKKLFWFCVMLLPPLGPALYCFIVYSRQSGLHAKAETASTLLQK